MLFLEFKNNFFYTEMTSSTTNTSKTTSSNEDLTLLVRNCNNLIEQVKSDNIFDVSNNDPINNLLFANTSGSEHNSLVNTNSNSSPNLPSISNLTNISSTNYSKKDSQITNDSSQASIVSSVGSVDSGGNGTQESIDLNQQLSVKETLQTMKNLMNDAIKQIKYLKVKNNILSSNNRDNNNNRNDSQLKVFQQQNDNLFLEYRKENKKLKDEVRVRTAKVSKYKKRIIEKNKEINKLMRVLNERAIPDSSNLRVRSYSEQNTDDSHSRNTSNDTLHAHDPLSTHKLKPFSNALLEKQQPTTFSKLPVPVTMSPPNTLPPPSTTNLNTQNDKNPDNKLVPTNMLKTLGFLASQVLGTNTSKNSNTASSTSVSPLTSNNANINIQTSNTTIIADETENQISPQSSNKTRDFNATEIEMTRSPDNSIINIATAPITNILPKMDTNNILTPNSAETSPNDLPSLHFPQLKSFKNNSVLKKENPV